MRFSVCQMGIFWVQVLLTDKDSMSSKIKGTPIQRPTVNSFPIINMPTRTNLVFLKRILLWSLNLDTISGGFQRPTIGTTIPSMEAWLKNDIDIMDRSLPRPAIILDHGLITWSVSKTKGTHTRSRSQWKLSCNGNVTNGTKGPYIDKKLNRFKIVSCKNADYF